MHSHYLFLIPHFLEDIIDIFGKGDVRLFPQEIGESSGEDKLFFHLIHIDLFTI
jgi:hypothetical protein